MGDSIFVDVVRGIPDASTFLTTDRLALYGYWVKGNLNVISTIPF